MLGPQKGPSSSAKITAEWKMILSSQDLITKAKNLAKSAHAGQKRWGGEDYFDAHVEQVAQIALKNSMKINDLWYCLDQLEHVRDTAVICAYLHDVLEDTLITKEYLLAIFPENIVNIVELLTKQEGESYLNFILRIKKSRIASFVKICDILHNLSTLPPKHKSKDKYELAKYILQEDFWTIEL